MEHATHGSPITVEGILERGGITVEVTTAGRWGARDSGMRIADERGRGLALMRGLTSGLEVEAEGATVTIRVRAAI